MTRARDFWASTVKPTVDEFAADPTSLRRGRVAAIVLHQMIDYWALEGYQTTTNSASRTLNATLRARLAAGCPDLLVVADVADATKHAVLTSTSRTVRTSEDVSQPPGLFQAPFGEAVFAEAAFVEVALTDGTRRSLIDAIENVMEMWEVELSGP